MSTSVAISVEIVHGKMLGMIDVQYPCRNFVVYILARTRSQPALYALFASSGEAVFASAWAVVTPNVVSVRRVTVTVGVEMVGIATIVTLIYPAMMVCSGGGAPQKVSGYPFLCHWVD